MPNFEYILVTIIVLVLILPYMMMRLSSRALVGKSAPHMDDVVHSDTDTSKPVFLYFMSKRCSNCREMTPLIKEEGQKNPNVIMINISYEREKGVRFGVRGTPTILSIRDGVIDRVKLGALKKSKLTEFLSS
jgi:thioredoxin 1